MGSGLSREHQIATGNIWLPDQGRASSYRHRSKLSPSCNSMDTDQKFRDQLAICKAAKFLFDAFPHASCADLARGIAKYRGVLTSRRIENLARRRGPLLTRNGINS